MGLISIGISIAKTLSNTGSDREINDQLYSRFLEGAEDSSDVMKNMDIYLKNKQIAKQVLKSKILEDEKRLGITAGTRPRLPKQSGMSMLGNTAQFAGLALIPAIEQTIQGVSSIIAIKSKNLTKQVQNDQFWEAAGDVATIAGFALAGQTALPIPGLGAIIGAGVGAIYVGVSNILGLEKERAMADIANDKARLLSMEQGTVRSTGNRGGFGV